MTYHIIMKLAGQERIAAVKNKLQVSRVILQKLSYKEDVSKEIIEDSLRLFDEAVNMLNNIAGWKKREELSNEVYKLLKARSKKVLCNNKF